MAKVTIVLEDHENEDGQTVLRVTPDFGGEYDEESIAQQYGEAIIDMIINNAENSEELTEKLLGGATDDTSRH